MQNPCDTDTSPLLLCHPRAPPAVMPGLHKCDALRLRYAKTSFCISFASFASDRAPPIPTITISLRHPRPFGPACFGFAQHKQGQAPARFPPRHPREGEDPLSSVKSARKQNFQAYFPSKKRLYSRWVFSPFEYNCKSTNPLSSPRRRGPPIKYEQQLLRLHSHQ